MREGFAGSNRGSCVKRGSHVKAAGYQGADVCRFLAGMFDKEYFEDSPEPFFHFGSHGAHA